MAEKEKFESVALVTDSSTPFTSSPRPYNKASLPPYGYAVEGKDQLHQRSSASSDPYKTEYFPTEFSSKGGSLAEEAFNAAQSGLYSLLRGTGEEKAKPAKLNRTAYLDGLRGFGAFLVYILHHEGWAHSTDVENATIFELNWGHKGNYNLISFPWIRTFFSGGHLAVAIFLVISGYVLAAKPLAFIHSKETVGLAENLCSALFRRWLRLFIPVAILTFLWMSSWHLFGIRSGGPNAPERTYFDEIWKWYCDFKNYSFIFHESWFNAYSFHVWTIPLEFRGSIVVYTACIAFARSGAVNRLRAECALIWYFMYIVDGWYCALFMIGMFLCDVDLLAMKNQLPRVLMRVRTQPVWVYYALTIFALYIGGITSIGNDIMELRATPGWYLLSFLKPQAMFNYAWFFRMWASTLLMISIPRITWLRRFFETRFCQYLGKISFGLYLVHGPILWAIGDRVYAAVGLVREEHYTLVPSWVNRYPFPSAGIYGLEVNFLAAQLVLLPLTLWLAELFTQLVDEPTVKFGHWLLKHHTTNDRGFVV